MPKFPHMNDTEFPHIDNVDVYKYQNELDYSRFDYSQMSIMMCCVPWDMGEAHVGARTISGIGNVVDFGSKEARDTWFAAIPDGECLRFDTKYKELHRDNEIVVPVPFDVAAKYNYLTVEYSLFANDDSKLQYEADDGLRRWFWFIREVEFVAPNATKLHLLNDAWQTFIYNVDIPYMILERGHAPMFEGATVDEYLGNPLENSGMLLEPDAVLENSNTRVADSGAVVFDEGDMYAVFVTSAAVGGAWGTNKTNNWKTPAAARYHTDGNLSYSHIAVAADDLYEFLNNIETEHPQFKQTVKCVYLISSKLFEITGTYTFGGVSVHLIGCGRKNEELLTLDVDMFGYDEKYKQIAKLYTFPYAYIEITDENGNAQIVKIEDTTGTLSVDYCFNSAFPALNLNAHIAGIGSDETQVVNFRNVGTRHFRIGGKWYDVQYDWAIPTFGVILEAAKEYDYAGYFDRQQAEVDYTAAYNNAVTNANVAYNNAKNSAETARDNAKDSAETSFYNAHAINAQQDANKAAESTVSAGQLWQNVVKTRDDVERDNDFIDVGRNVAGQQLAMTAVSNGIGSIATGTFNGAVTGGVAGAAIGAGIGALNATAGAMTSMVSWGAGNVIANEQKEQNYNKSNNAFALTAWQSQNIYGTNMTAAFENDGTDITFSGHLGNFAGGVNYQISHDMLAISNYTARADRYTVTGGTLSQRTVNDGAPTGYSSLDITIPERNLIGTAERSKTTADGNAKRTKDAVYDENETGTADRDRAVAIDRINNITRSEGMRAPYEFGTWANAENANVKPKMLAANVITQGAAGIAYAGDEMLRYGYRYNRNWNFDGNWCVGKYYTYWKLSDFWVKGLNVPDMYMDKLRFFLFGGVTVWRHPEDIGHVSIYENGADDE